MKKLLTILFLSALSCLAKEKVEKPLRVGISMGIPPMTYTEDGKVVGVEMDLLKEFAKRNNLKYKLINLNFNELIPAVKEGLIDVAMGTISYTKARAERVDFSKPYIKISQMPLVHKEKSLRYQSNSMLLNTVDNVCVVDGYTGSDFATVNFPYAKILRAKNTAKALDMILKKQADVFVADSVLVMWLASNYKSEGLMVLPILLKKEDVCWAVKKGNTALLNKLNNFIDELKQEEILDEIIRQRIPYYDSTLYKVY